MSPADVAVLRGERRRDQQRTDLAVRWPVRHDVERPAEHRDHHLACRAGRRSSSCGCRGGRAGRRWRARSRPRCGAAPGWRGRSSLSASGAESLGWVVEVLVGVDAEAAVARGRVVAAARRSRSARRGCAGRRGRWRTKRTPRRATTTRGRVRWSPTRSRRRSASCLERLELGGQVARRRPGRPAAGPAGARRASGPSEMPDLGHRDADARRREDKRDLQVVLEVLADVGRVELARQRRRLRARRFGPMPESSRMCGEPTAPALSTTSLVALSDVRSRRPRCGTRRPCALQLAGIALQDHSGHLRVS